MTADDKTYRLPVALAAALDTGRKELVAVYRVQVLAAETVGDAVTAETLDEVLRLLGDLVEERLELRAEVRMRDGRLKDLGLQLVGLARRCGVGDGGDL